MKEMISRNLDLAVNMLEIIGMNEEIIKDLNTLKNLEGIKSKFLTKLKAHHSPWTYVLHFDKGVSSEEEFRDYLGRNGIIEDGYKIVNEGDAISEDFRYRIIMPSGVRADFYHPQKE